MGLDRLLRPKSVAVVGGTEAERVIEQLDLLGYAGEIWPVHPFRSQMVGRRCLPSTDDLTAPPDAAFVAVPRDATPMVVAALADAGTGAAVVYTSGFGESGDDALQTQLVAAAGRMPLLGPNCYGFVNVFDGTAIWPDVHGLRPLDRGVGIITQSGNIGINLTMARRSVDIGLVVTAGNQAVLDIPTLLEALLDDVRITAIGIQLESLADGVAFGDAARRAHEAGVPLVALRMGASERGGLVTASHTGALVGDDAAYDALFRRYGVARVHDIPTFLEALKLTGRVPHRPQVVSLSSSGGEAAHVADVAHDAGLELPQLTPEHAAAIAATAGPLVAVSNPMDYHTFSWGDEDAMRRTFAAVVTDRFDVAMLVLDFPDGDIPAAWWNAVRAFAAAAGTTPGLVVASLPETMPLVAQEHIRSLGLIPMLGMVETIHAIAALGAVAGIEPLPHLAPPPPPDRTATLDEAASKAMLALAGIDVPAGVKQKYPDASGIPFPVTLKVLGIDHKTEAGAVAVGIRDAAELKRRIETMPRTGAYLVEETIVGGVLELMVSLRAVDRIGWLLTLAAGGVAVELIDDRVHLLAPASPQEIGDALRGLRAFAIGRWQHPPALGAVTTVMESLQTLCHDGRVIEAEINPLIVTPSRAVAADAMVTVR